MWGEVTRLLPSSAGAEVEALARNRDERRLGAGDDGAVGRQFAGHQQLAAGTFGDADPAFHRQADRYAGFVAHGQFARERGFDPEREQEAEHVVEQRGHDAAMAATGRAFVGRSEHTGRHDLVTLTPHAKVEPPRTRPTGDGSLVVAGEVDALFRGLTPVADRPVLAAGSRRTVSELVGEPVERGADAIDLGERRVTAAITGFAQLLSAAGPRPTDVMSSPAANAFS